MTRVAAASRKERTVCSALWAAYGDAIGFTTELATASMLKQRVGAVGPVEATVPWQRLIGGRFGALVEMPAGTYSDDTQLRLATSRSIRHDGFFDVESLAKIELPVWLGYALGGGLGSKAAATALAGSSTTWFSNFFRTDRATYIGGGGNGAAMRIQPHVWAAADLSSPLTYLADVVRNAVTTHGHVRGIAGAMIHAVILAYVLREEKLPHPEEWGRFASVPRLLPEIVEANSDLRTFWLPTWERECGFAIDDASSLVGKEWLAACSQAKNALCKDGAEYATVVESLAGLRPEERGSGLKSALFSVCAAWAFCERGPAHALAAVANLLNSDTDTIATMTGALLGGLPDQVDPDGQVQDRDYIRFEAIRLYDVSQRRGESSFSYPDLLYWQPPKTSLDVLGTIGEENAIYGLGKAEAIGSVYPTKQNDTVLQWFKLEFGQTVLCKRRAKPRPLPTSAEPSLETLPFDLSHLRQRTPMPEQDLFPTKPTVSKLIDTVDDQLGQSLDDATDEAIRSEFNPAVVGSQLLRFADSKNGLELAIAYAAVMVKAKRARLKRGNRIR
jgi:ADP-ribosylglycohydrolase